MAHPRLLGTYRDALGTDRTPPEWATDVVDGYLHGVGPGRYVDVVRIRAGQRSPLPVGSRLRLESGDEVVLGDTIPHDLPFGYHEVEQPEGLISVLHAPARVPPPPARGWVLAAQLYAARSARSWGHGDLRDARELARWVSDSGPDGFVMLNPLHAAIPGPSPQPSPYFASSRAYRNPIYLSIDDIDGVPSDVLGLHADAARALNASDLIDREKVWAHKSAVLEATWTARREHRDVRGAVAEWIADEVNARYAAFGASRGETEASADPEYHAWLQATAEAQVRAAGPNLIHDVAVGTDRAGADAHLWPDCFVTDDGLRIGCPPDQFNTQGQDWGLPPLHPDALRSCGYEPFVRAVRAAATGAAGIRIDHVMALERTFWIPGRGGPADGVYVRYALDEMLDVIAIEAHRAGAFVVGEDLGTVPPSLPPALADRGILSYRVMALDHQHPREFQERCMAASTTHDLPTLVGLLSGTDLADQAALGLKPNEADTNAAADRLRHWAEPTDGTVHGELVRIHEVLATSPASLVAATLDDLAGATRRPNMPGTIDEWPNWRIPLTPPIETVLSTPLATDVRRVMQARAS